MKPSELQEKTCHQFDCAIKTVIRHRAIDFYRAIRRSEKKEMPFAEIMDLTPYALQMKIDNETEFKASEIDTLANTLGMDMQQRDSIFFCKKSGI